MATKRFLLLLVTIYFITVCRACRRQIDYGPRQALRKPVVQQRLSSIVRNLTLSLYAEMAPHHQNLIFSPLGILQSVAMIFLGAKNATANEIIQTFGFSTFRRTRGIHGALKQWSESMSEEMYNISLTNTFATFLPVGRRLKPLYNRKIQQFYPTDVEYISRTSSASQYDELPSVMANRIQNFPGPDMFPANNGLWQFNFINFKAPWEDYFDPDNTYRGVFHVSSDQNVEVDMMYIESAFNTTRYYVKVSPYNSASVYAIPYTGNRFSFVILLPNAVDGLNDLEQSLEARKLDYSLTAVTHGPIIESFNPNPFHLHLPKMKLTSQLNIKEALSRLGTEKIFQEGVADLSGMDSHCRLFVDEMTHVSILDIEEGGTGDVNVTCHNITEAYTVKVDRPFMFVVRDKLTQSNVFIGKVTNPVDLV